MGWFTRGDKREGREGPAPTGAPEAPAATIPPLDEVRDLRSTAERLTPLPLHLRAVHHVIVPIPAHGEEAARDFWTYIMGLREVDKPGHLAGSGVWFRGEGVEVHCPPVEPFEPVHDDPPAFLVDDADYAARQLREAGVRVQIASKAWPGLARVVLSDPFGSRLRLVSRTDAPGA